MQLDVEQNKETDNTQNEFRELLSSVVGAAPSGTHAATPSSQHSTTTHTHPIV